MEGNYIVMFRYSTIYINLVSFFITLIIFLFGEYVISNYDLISAERTEIKSNNAEFNMRLEQIVRKMFNE